MKRRGQQPPSISGQQLPSSSGLTAVEKPGTTISLPRTVHLSVQHCAHGGAPNLASRASAQQKSVKFWKWFLQGRAPLALGCARRRRYFWRKWTPWTPSAPPAAKRHGQQTSSSITRTWSARSGNATRPAKLYDALWGRSAAMPARDRARCTDTEHATMQAASLS